MRGRIYEDESTGLPNSRHFVFELRRQMMRSVRNGRGLARPDGLRRFRAVKANDDRVLPAVSARCATPSGGDFVAHQGPIFAAIITDDQQTAAEKADLLLRPSARPSSRIREPDVPGGLLSGYEANSKCAASCAGRSATSGARANALSSRRRPCGANRRSQPAVA
jgi:hypothetical protein